MIATGHESILRALDPVVVLLDLDRRRPGVSGFILRAARLEMRHPVMPREVSP